MELQHRAHQGHGGLPGRWMAAAGRHVGCVCLYPAAAAGHDVEVQSWVRADRAELDVPLADAVTGWLGSHWPWERPDRRGR